MSSAHIAAAKAAYDQVLVYCDEAEKWIKKLPEDKAIQFELQFKKTRNLAVVPKFGWASEEAKDSADELEAMVLKYGNQHDIGASLYAQIISTML